MIMAKRRIAVVAVGGNALTLPGERSEIEEELAHARAVARRVRVAGIAITNADKVWPDTGITKVHIARFYEVCHWGWVCDRRTDRQAVSLAAPTRHQLALVNGVAHLGPAATLA